MTAIYILGAGGFGREVAEGLICSPYSFEGYIVPDSCYDSIGKQVGRHKIVATQSELKNHKNIHNRDFAAWELAATIAIGTPSIIRKVAEDLAGTEDLIFPNLGAYQAGWNVTFGHGNIICSGNIFTTDIKVGNHNIFNLGNTIGHDVNIGNYCVINPGCHISGGATIEDACLIGTGAIILENITIGTGATVGGGAVVTKDVPPGTTVVGIPAKPLNKTTA